MKIFKPLLIFYFVFATIFSEAQNKLPEFKVYDTYGRFHQLSDYLNNGKYIFVHFFWTSCGTCHIEAPKVQQVYENFGCNTGDVVFFGIDRFTDNQAVNDFKDDTGSNYILVSGIEGGGKSVHENFNIAYAPMGVLISPQGDILTEDINVDTPDMLSDTLLYYGNNLQNYCKGNDILSFMFEKSLNPYLGNDCCGSIDFDKKIIEIQNNEIKDNVLLTASFESSSKSNVYFNGEEQFSGVTVNDFSSGSCLYEVTAEDGSSQIWTVLLSGFSNMKESTDEYIKIFPEPVTGNSVIQLPDINENYDISIFSPNGNLIFYKSRIKNENIKFSEFYSKLSNGIYLLSIKSRNSLFNKKFAVTEN